MLQQIHKMGTQVNIDDKYKRAAVQVAKMYGIQGCDEWDDLSEAWRRYLVDNVSYKQLVKPLVWADRGRGLTWQQLSNKYSLTLQEVRTICATPYRKAKLRQR